ncbi:MAG TPA: ABC transporter ATP-binding protein, partial [Polyangiaceae bacterium]|nr:ABC transporter ATP-binding protein [Polyangiaceae bacterium]
VAPAAVECEGLIHAYDTKPVLNGVTFQVAKGSVYGFIGPNGAGKTTTLRILATLLEPTGGTARIAGHDVTSHPELVRRVLGYMPDTPGTYERVGVGEYLDFFASAHGMHGAARRAAVERAIELTEIGPLRPSQVTSLSKGQRQRLLLARTLLHDPEVLLLDEPASDLDPRARIELRTLLAKLGRMGKTILLSSHILTELAELCDAIGVLEGGRIVVSGPIDEVEALAANLVRGAHAGRRVRITVIERGDDAAAVLQASPLVRAVVAIPAERPGFRTFEVAHDGDERVVAELVSLLAREQIAVCAVEPERADLERIFMDVTARSQAPRAATPEPGVAR